MNTRSLTTQLSLLRGGWRVVSFLLRHLVTIVLVLLALVLGYRAWQTGFPATMSLPVLMPLLLCLILIVAVLLGRRGIRCWALERAARGQRVLQKRLARRMAQKGREKGEQILEKGEEALERGVGAARQALSSLVSEVQADWQRPGAPTQPRQRQAPRCPHCGYFVRPGAKFCDRCGKPLSLTCPHCDQALRPQARFCEHCGTPVGGERSS
ncbi:MAG: zinc ribbon domain-containing protein [Anaerolineae bacterium]|nr:zinc ribbon domain-containing protein [Anaerolineae bacterium]